MRDPFGWVGAAIDGRFRVEAVAGEGSFGVVYRGRHLGFDEPVAIKCLKVPVELEDDERASFLASFHDEAKLLLRLSRYDRGIVQALDVGAAVAPGGRWTPYIVMEWLEGQTLEKEIAARVAAGAPKRTIDEALDLFAPAASALAVAHAEGVSHRDIKPANLFVAHERGKTTLRVLDFGIAKVLCDSPAMTSAMKRSGKAIDAFTPQYGAPEQFSKRHGATGPWTDVFASALVLIEIAAGRPALEGDSPMQLYISSCDPHARPGLAACGVPASVALERAFRRAVEVEPARRYETMTELWAALEAARTGAVAETVRAESPAGSGPVALRGQEAPVEVALAPDAEPRGGPEENRLCTVLFAELSVATSGTDRTDPEQLRDVLAACFDVFAERVQRFGGRVDKIVGTTFVALFGLARASDNDAERAVRAALAMTEALGKMSTTQRALRRQRPSLRVGIDTGRVASGVIGGGTNRDFTVVGGPVATAARLQQAAPAGAVLVARDTWRQIAASFDVERAAPVLDGEASIATYRIVGPKQLKDPIAPSDFYGAPTKLVGRSTEIGRLAELFETALVERRPQIVTLSGPPGVGRSRIVAEVAARARGDARRTFVAASQASALATDQSYGVVAALLQSAFSIASDDPVDDAVLRLEGAMRDLAVVAPGEGGAALEDALREVGALVGAAPPTAREASAESLAPDDRGAHAQRRIVGAVARLLGAVAQTTAVVLLLDDAQWADDASLDLIDELALHLAEQPVFVLVSARPDLFERRPHWGEGKSAHVRVEVAPLSKRHVVDMVRDRMGLGEGEADELGALLVERAEGNPRTLVETLHLLVDDGVLVRDERGAWRAEIGRLSALTLPPTIQGIVQARLDRLEPDAREALAYAAVIGRVFWQGALEQLRLEVPGTQPSGAVRRSVAELLGVLRERQLVRQRDASSFPGEREFVFAELATQEVAYDTLPQKVRRRLHRVVAPFLAARLGRDAGAAVLAFHHDRGGDPRSAAAEYARAAAHAAAIGRNVEARRLLERCRDLHDEASGEPDERVRRAPTGDADDRVASWRDRARVRLELGDVLRRLGHLDEADGSYDEARARILRLERRAAESLDPAEGLRWEARVDFRLGLGQRVRNEAGAALALVERAIDAATRGGAVDETAGMWAVVAAIHRRTGALEASKKAALRGLGVCRAAGARDARWREAVSHLLGALGGVLFSQGRLVAAERCCRQAARVVDERTQPHPASIAINLAGAMRFARGDHEGARAAFARFLPLAERLGDLHDQAIAHNNLAEVELLLGAPTALDHADKSVTILRRLGAEADLPDALRNFAEALVVAGRRREGLAACVEGFERARVASGRVYLAALGASLARIARASWDDPTSDSATRAEVARAVRALVAELPAAQPASDDETEVRSAVDVSAAASRALVEPIVAADADALHPAPPTQTAGRRSEGAK